MMRKTIALAILAILFIAVLPASQAALSNTGISPRGGEPGDYTFTLRYTGASAPTSVQLVIGEVVYDMSDVEPGDLNYSDGKDYIYTTSLEAGTHAYYYRVIANGDLEVSPTLTTNIVEPGIGFEHMDVVLAVAIVGAVFMVPVIYLLLVLRRMAHSLHKHANKDNEEKEENAGSENDGSD